MKKLIFLLFFAAIAFTPDTKAAYVKNLNVVNIFKTSANESRQENNSEMGNFDQSNAFANDGCKFYNWTENRNVVSANALYSFVASVNRFLVANSLSTVRIPESKSQEVRVYPNPTDAMVYLEAPGSSITKVKVSDPSGRMVFQIFPSDGEWRVSLNLSGLKRGVYAIQITSKDGNVTNRKVVLQK